jgi:transposase
MAERIYPRTVNGHTYYYLQRTWREKLDPTATGKTRGSGKSRVRTEKIYLGSAASILKKLQENPRKAIEARHRSFGFVMAIYQTALDIGLVDLLQQHFPGTCYGVCNWLYFLLPMINRLESATSKEKMGSWSVSTVLPTVLQFDPGQLDSNSFWYATDEFISERALRDRRKKTPDLEDRLFVGLEDRLFNQIEEKLATTLQQQFDLSWNVIVYDTTNFFTYFEEPLRSRLARSGHNKAYRHHMKQVGLALCVEKEWGIPLFHRVYRGNSHDSKTFAQVVNELMAQIKSNSGEIANLVLVLDKGNNSEANFALLKDRIQWVGSLVPSHYSDLMRIPLSSYSGRFKEWDYYTSHSQVMKIDCKLVLTYNESLAKKQKHTITNGVQKLKKRLLERWNEYKRTPKKVPAGLLSIIKKDRYGKYLKLEYQNGKLLFLSTDCYSKQELYFGKNLLFTDQTGASAEWVIDQYHSKEKIEDGFKLLKDPGLIRWQPMRHWTDTKIRAFAFCAVMSLALIRVMELKAAKAGLKMSAAVLKEELADLREITMIYDDKTAQRLISQRSSVQQKLWDLFQLGMWKKHLSIH